MPLARYFGFVGTALLVLLLGVSWLVSEPVPGVASKDINKPVIRISSIEKLPERVIFDTSLPQTPPPTVIVFAAQPVRSAFEFVQITPGRLPAITPARLPVIAMTDEVAPRGPKIVKRDPSKKLSAHRSAPPANAPPVPSVQAKEPVTRLSLIDVIKSRFGRGLF
jgi:hypothetical protein